MPEQRNRMPQSIGTAHTGRQCQSGCDMVPHDVPRRRDARTSNTTASGGSSNAAQTANLRAWQEEVQSDELQTISSK